MFFSFFSCAKKRTSICFFLCVKESKRSTLLSLRQSDRLCRLLPTGRKKASPHFFYFLYFCGTFTPPPRLRGYFCDIRVFCVTIYTRYPPNTRYAMINNTMISKTKRPSVLQKQVSKKLAIYNNRRCCFYSISIGRVTLTNRVFQI